MNRGSARSRAARGPGEGRFNEAPIHESGKCPETVPMARLHAASMRPRFMNRGSGGSGRRVRRGRHRFNEAPIHESGK